MSPRYGTLLTVEERLDRLEVQGPSEENDGFITVVHRDFIKNTWYGISMDLCG